MLVLRPGALGDTLLTVPALRALRAARPAVPLWLAAHSAATRLLVELGEVDRGLPLDAAELAWIFQPTPTAVAEPPLEVVAWVTSASVVPGLEPKGRLGPSRPTAPDEHVADYLRRTLVEAGFAAPGPRDARPFPALVPRVTAEILIHPGSGAAAKNWPADRFAEVVRLVDGPVRLIVGEADGAAAAAVDAALGWRMPRLTGLPLGELATRLAGCRAYVGNDSGVSHLAGLCGAPTVTLWGPTSPATWAPLGRHVKTLPFSAAPADVARCVVGQTA